MNVQPGTVYLVGGGPGAADLITVRGLKVLRQADVVLYDALIDPSLPAEAPIAAKRIDVGKRSGQASPTQAHINRLLVRHAREGLVVVRLKGGDPFVFGRGGEELEACRRHGIPVEVIPGVSAAFAAPAAAGIPVTHRKMVRSLAVVTASTVGEDGAAGLNYAALAGMDAVIVMMGRSKLQAVVVGMLHAGRAADTPVACIEKATTAKERVICGTLGTIVGEAERWELRSPMVTIIGESVRMAHLWPRIESLRSDAGLHGQGILTKRGHVPSKTAP